MDIELIHVEADTLEIITSSEEEIVAIHTAPEVLELA